MGHGPADLIALVPSGLNSWLLDPRMFGFFSKTCLDFFWFFLPPLGPGMGPKCAPEDQLTNPEVTSKSGRWRPDWWAKYVLEKALSPPRKQKRTSLCSKDFSKSFLFFFGPSLGPPGAEIWPECGPSDQLSNPNESSKSGQRRSDPWKKTVSKIIEFREIIVLLFAFLLIRNAECSTHCSYFVSRWFVPPLTPGPFRQGDARQGRVDEDDQGGVAFVRRRLQSG